MKFTFNGTEYNVPQKEVLRLAATLKVTPSEACKIYLEDEGKIINPEQDALDKKASKVKIDHGATSQAVIEKKMTAKPKTDKPKTTKANPTKERVISDIAEMLGKYCENVTIVNSAKVIEFSLNGNNFKIDLTQKRVPKS